jgi:hypothetical protein
MHERDVGMAADIEIVRKAERLPTNRLPPTFDSFDLAIKTSP